MSEKKKNIFGGVKKYFKDVKGEMKKVVWPTRKQLVKSTIIVIVCCLIVGAFIALLDLGLGQSLGKIFEKNEAVESPIVNTEGMNVETEAPAAEAEGEAPAEEAPAEETAPAEEAEAEAEDAQ